MERCESVASLQRTLIISTDGKTWLHRRRHTRLTGYQAGAATVINRGRCSNDA
jgi:hypothetical protein